MKIYCSWKYENPFGEDNLEPSPKISPRVRRAADDHRGDQRTQHPADHYAWAIHRCDPPGELPERGRMPGDEGGPRSDGQRGGVCAPGRRAEGERPDRAERDTLREGPPGRVGQHHPARGRAKGGASEATLPAVPVGHQSDGESCFRAWSG